MVKLFASTSKKKIGQFNNPMLQTQLPASFTFKKFCLANKPTKYDDMLFCVSILEKQTNVIQLFGKLCTIAGDAMKTHE